MKIKWLGHAMFEINDEASGIAIITDPYAEEVGYPVKERKADIVTASHDHYDHNNLSSVKAEKILTGNVDEVYNGVRIVSFQTYHDEAMGKKRGTNFIFKFYGELTVAHLGDYGEQHLRAEVKDFLSDADIVLLPVGGIYTIGPEEAISLIEAVQPAVVIPMHYKTAYLKFELLGVDEFLKRINRPVKQVFELKINKESLPSETSIFVLDCAV